MDTFTDKKSSVICFFVEVVKSVEEEKGKRNAEHAGKKAGKKDFMDMV